MCGRFTLTAPAHAVEELFPLFDGPTDAVPRYNVAPTQPVLAVRRNADGALELTSLRWGLVPSWADDPAIGSRLINARSDSVAAKPAFRAAFKRRRCLVVADGFYEWLKKDKQKLPYYIRLRDDGPFAFAGLWEHWQRDDRSIESCSLLTTEANELMRPLHDRMPVILPRAAYERWLDPDSSAAGLQALLCPFPSEEMKNYPVSTHVNNSRHEDAQCIEPISEGESRA